MIPSSVLVNTSLPFIARSRNSNVSVEYSYQFKLSIGYIVVYYFIWDGLTLLPGRLASILVNYSNLFPWIPQAGSCIDSLFAFTDSSVAFVNKSTNQNFVTASAEGRLYICFFS